MPLQPAKLLALAPFLLSGSFAAADDVQLAREAEAALRKYCAACHYGPGSRGPEFDVKDLGSLFEEGWIAPGDAEGSPIYDAIASGRMPVPGNALVPKMTSDAKKAIADWINADAPGLASTDAEKTFVPLDAVYAAMISFLREQDPDERPYFRFFTLHHFYNSPHSKPSDVAGYQAALSKAINSLSWSQRVIPPTVVQSESLHGTVLAIDLRDYESHDGQTWDETGHWDNLSQAYPYGLSYGNLRDAGRQRKLEEIRDLLTKPHSPTVLTPMLRVDWFVATATRPRLYHKLLGIPENAETLRRLLVVDRAKAMLNPSLYRIARAGFRKSGVSRQNRVIERYQSRYGYYWESYDFAPGKAQSNLFRFPVGPREVLSGGLARHADLAFQHDGGEIIFSLPNGLQGYMLVDATGNRIDAGPIAIVFDERNTSGTPEIINGLSCINCHAGGIRRDFSDEIRDFSVVGGEVLELTRKLYPEQAELDELVVEDRERFHAALWNTVKPYGIARAAVYPPEDPYEWGEGEKKDKTAEHVGDLARAYATRQLKAGTIAAELDFESPDQLVKSVGERVIERLGLASVFAADSDLGVSRDEWQGAGPGSVPLMQELAREAKMTTIY